MTPLRQARNDLARIQAHGHHELAAHAQAALERLTTWNTHGYPAAGTNGNHGDIADPTGHAASRHDEIGNWITATTTAIHHIAVGLDALDRSAAWSRPLTPRQVLAVLAGQRSTSGCKDCGRTIAGTKIDPVVGGRCLDCRRKRDAERQARHRAGLSQPEDEHVNTGSHTSATVPGLEVATLRPEGR